MVLVGTTMDYGNDDIKSEFVFRNPNEKGQCGFISDIALLTKLWTLFILLLNYFHCS